MKVTVRQGIKAAGRARLPACNLLSSSRSDTGPRRPGIHNWPRADVTKPYRRPLALSMAVALAALSASCGDVNLPDAGEAAALRIVDGNEQVGPAGAALGEPVIVRVLDSDDQPVPAHEVTFVIASGGGSVEPEAVTTDANGLASATWTLGGTAGAQELKARTIKGGDGGPLEVSFTATAVAGSGSVLVGVSGDDQTGPVNSALADSLVVKATDALGNPVANVEVTWSVSGGGSISPVTVLTGADGLAAAERVLGPTAGAQSAQATVEGFTGSPVEFSHTAAAGQPHGAGAGIGRRPERARRVRGRPRPRGAPRGPERQRDRRAAHHLGGARGLRVGEPGERPDRSQRSREHPMDHAGRGRAAHRQRGVLRTSAGGIHGDRDGGRPHDDRDGERERAERGRRRRPHQPARSAGDRRQRQSGAQCAGGVERGGRRVGLGGQHADRRAGARPGDSHPRARAGSIHDDGLGRRAARVAGDLRLHRHGRRCRRSSRF